LRIIASLLGLLLGLASWGCNKLGLGGNGNPTGPSSPPAAGSSVRYTALGASDANGVGSSVPCFPFTECADGKGYVPVAIRQLRALGYQVTPLNLGVAGAVISRRFQTLGNMYGRDVIANFHEAEMPFVQRDATVVTIFAGGNDVNVVLAAVNAGAAGPDVNGYVDQQVRLFGDDYQTLLDGIRSSAPSARIVALNLPNLGGAPYLMSSPVVQQRVAQRAAVGMTTTVINPLTSRGVVVIDLMCDGRFYQAANFSSDGFHPNDGGYQILADEVVRAITSGGYPAPQSSCAPMTLVP
jgi:lysophospholipase L1-like esterase